jgi:hypothetical protein
MPLVRCAAVLAAPFRVRGAPGFLDAALFVAPFRIAFSVFLLPFYGLLNEFPAVFKVISMAVFLKFCSILCSPFLNLFFIIRVPFIISSPAAFFAFPPSSPHVPIFSREWLFLSAFCAGSCLIYGLFVAVIRYGHLCLSLAEL